MSNFKKYGLYVDGLNFYYGLFKHYPQYKWLNIKLLFESFKFENFKLSFIKYFTAKVIPSKENPSVHIR